MTYDVVLIFDVLVIAVDDSTDHDSVVALERHRPVFFTSGRNCSAR